MLVGIRGMGTCLAPDILSNEELAETSGVTVEWIRERTGVKRRYVAPEGVASSDLGAQALTAALKSAGLTADQLDLIICATTTPDDLGPAVACRIQHRIGASRATAFDISAACAGWVFGMKVARDWIQLSGGYVAVVTADLYHKFINPTEARTAVLFSDGAAATILGPSDYGILDMLLKSDGAGANHIYVPAGGSRITMTHEALDEGLNSLHMDGLGLIRFTRQVFPEMVRTMLERNNLTMDDLACVVAHQPNPKLVADIGKRAEVPEEKMVIVGDEVGNLGASAAPFALAKAVNSGQVTEGSTVLGVAFGAGANWGGSLFTWGDVHIEEASYSDETKV